MDLYLPGTDGQLQQAAIHAPVLTPRLQLSEPQLILLRQSPQRCHPHHKCITHHRLPGVGWSPGHSTTELHPQLFAFLILRQGLSSVAEAGLELLPSYLQNHQWIKDKERSFWEIKR